MSLTGRTGRRQGVGAGARAQRPTADRGDAADIGHVREAGREPPPEATAKVTPTPETGLPNWSLTMTLGAVETAVPTVVDWLLPSLMAMVAAVAAVPVALKVTGEPVSEPLVGGQGVGARGSAQSPAPDRRDARGVGRGRATGQRAAAGGDLEGDANAGDRVAELVFHDDARGGRDRRADRGRLVVAGVDGDGGRGGGADGDGVEYR